jgi:hypothetical protein
MKSSRLRAREKAQSVAYVFFVAGTALPLVTVEVRANTRIAASFPLATYPAALLSRSACLAQLEGLARRAARRCTRFGEPRRPPRGNTENGNDSSQEPIQNHFGPRHGPSSVTPRSGRRLSPSQVTTRTARQPSRSQPGKRGPRGQAEFHRFEFMGPQPGPRSAAQPRPQRRTPAMTARQVPPLPWKYGAPLCGIEVVHFRSIAALAQLRTHSVGWRFAALLAMNASLREDRVQTRQRCNSRRSSHVSMNFRG